MQQISTCATDFFFQILSYVAPSSDCTIFGAFPSAMSSTASTCKQISTYHLSWQNINPDLLNIITVKALLSPQGTYLMFDTPEGDLLERGAYSKS